jgi:hypothetical protein
MTDQLMADPEAERQRRLKAARDAAFVQATSVLLWVTDPFGHVPEDSPSWRAFTGLSFDDLMTPWGWALARQPVVPKRAFGVCEIPIEFVFESSPDGGGLRMLFGFSQE